MNKYKICVYAICKNEEDFVDRWMDAVSEADLVVVLDTGSTDSTVEKLKSRGALVRTEIIDPWRFDEARNKAMDFIPEDVDICVSNDLDEVFEKGWREKLEDAWESTTTRANYTFTWGYHKDGTPSKQFRMEKIHSRKGFRWIHPVHEVLEYKGVIPDSTVYVPEIILNHYPDLSKPRSQYLPLLELSAKENPDDDRVAFWLGREYMFYEMYAKSISTLKKYLKMPSAVWDEERCAAMRFISKSFLDSGDKYNAKIWLYRAVAECPRVREPFLYMARLAYSENNWPLVYLMVTEALKITERSGSYLLEQDCWGYELYDLGSISTFQLGLIGKSYENAKKAFDMNPEHVRLKNNLELIENKLHE